eukprot:CAMPEP_0113495840 /NCGR_PEP_ID=MMETSP0014_2-20120614/29813_1 /TAXON_ID=2857 /ORGANISM="Nitzschia sp." /LENGTH=544 /DNA_ID=CAMNT_0000389743 /DNA_START=24 /DNA_END=1658 /DNA_ORIENTATION=+ /assembly_acc=CAM_ASM_000159
MSDTNQDGTKPPKKTKEDLDREQKEAAEQLTQMLKTTKPKNLPQGVGRGVGNIVGGAVGAVGIAVLAPTVGLASGLRGGGIIGGALGVTVGAVIGILGAAGLIIGGAVSGVSQIVRGVIAVPESITAPKSGKWWNETEGRWVYTDLTKVDVPENDDDLLKDLEAELDSKAFDGPSTTVVDTYYYEVLSVESNAEETKIKRQYYKMARMYHPDRNPGDAEAAAKFKEAAEAYQVLSDPELRAKYDKLGKDALSGDKTSAVDDQKPDPNLILAYLFGSDQFNDYIGRLATSTSAMLGDSPKLSAKDARTLQVRRCTRLATKLVSLIDGWVNGDMDSVEVAWRIEGVALSKASYGWELLQVIGMAYEVVAVQFLGSNDSGLGMPSIAKWAEGKKAGNKLAKAGSKNQWEALMATMDAMKVQQEYQKKLAEATSPEEKQKLEKEMADAITSVMLKIVWSTTSVDIVVTVHEAAQMVFFDQSVDSETRMMRAKAVKKLGEIFVSIPEPQVLDGARKGAKQLFEEAAMAATLETLKRKDEANFAAGAYSQ